MILHSQAPSSRYRTSHRCQTFAAVRLQGFPGERQKYFSNLRKTIQSSTGAPHFKVTAISSNQRQYGKAAEVSTAIWLLSQLPANAAESAVDFSKGSFSTQSYVVTLGLFLISLPGICQNSNSVVWTILLCPAHQPETNLSLLCLDKPRDFIGSVSYYVGIT